jgi:hypothetical protein
MKYLKSAFLDKLLEKDVTKTIFDNIRNFLYCALFLALGTQAIVAPSSTIGFYDTGIVISGLVLIVISLLLLALNILDGIHKLSRVGIPAYVYPFIILIYLIVVVRFVLFAYGYRLH